METLPGRAPSSGFTIVGRMEPAVHFPSLAVASSLQGELD